MLQYVSFNKDVNTDLSKRRKPELNKKIKTIQLKLSGLVKEPPRGFRYGLGKRDGSKKLGTF